MVSDILGVSARHMLEALIAGVRDVEALAELAHTRMRPKIPQLRRALEGRFGTHHALMLRMHLEHIDQLSANIERLDLEVDRVVRPFAAQLQHLITIPGVGRRTAEVIIAEVGVDMRRFATAGHLASWAGMCPGNHESGGKRRSGRGPQGQQGAAGRAVRSRLVGQPLQDRLPTRPVSTSAAHLREEGSDPRGVRRRAQHPDHRLAHARPGRRLPRPR